MNIWQNILSYHLELYIKLISRLVSQMVDYTTASFLLMSCPPSLFCDWAPNLRFRQGFHVGPSDQKECSKVVFMEAQMVSLMLLVSLSLVFGSGIPHFPLDDTNSLPNQVLVLLGVRAIQYHCTMMFWRTSCLILLRICIELLISSFRRTCPVPILSEVLTPGLMPMLSQCLTQCLPTHQT